MPEPYLFEIKRPLAKLAGAIAFHGVIRWPSASRYTKQNFPSGLRRAAQDLSFPVAGAVGLAAMLLLPYPLQQIVHFSTRATLS